MSGRDAKQHEGEGELQFPLVWHGRVIVHDLDGVGRRIDEILQAHGFAESAERGRTSKNGRYVTFRVSLTIPDRDVFAAVTDSLEQLHGVKMVL